MYVDQAAFAFGRRLYKQSAGPKSMLGGDGSYKAPKSQLGPGSSSFTPPKSQLGPGSGSSMTPGPTAAMKQLSPAGNLGAMQKVPSAAPAMVPTQYMGFADKPMRMVPATSPQALRSSNAPLPYNGRGAIQKIPRAATAPPAGNNGIMQRIR